MSAMGLAVLASLPLSFVPMSPACSTTASTAGLRSTLAQVGNSISLLSKKELTGPVLFPSAGVNSFSLHLHGMDMQKWRVWLYGWLAFCMLLGYFLMDQTKLYGW